MLTVLAGAFLGIVLWNTMKLDIPERACIAVIIIGFSYLVAHEIQKQKANLVPAIPSPPALTARQPAQNAPAKPTKKKAPPRSPVPLQALSDGQRFALKKELSVLAGNNVRIVQIGENPNTQILNEQLLDVFAGWNINNPYIGQGPIVSNTPYLTSTDVSSQLVRQVYEIFHRFGVDLNLVPGGYMGPASLGSPDGIVIVIK